ncbi:MAG: hypothetical protein QXY70_01305 [Nanopusillaceae archaeon]
MENAIRLLKDYLEKGKKLTVEEIDEIFNTIKNVFHLKYAFLNILSHPKASEMLEDPQKSLSKVKEIISSFDINELEKIDISNFVTFLQQNEDFLKEENLKKLTKSPQKEIATLVYYLKKKDYFSFIKNLIFSFSVFPYIKSLFVTYLKEGNVEQNLKDFILTILKFNDENAIKILTYLIDTDLSETLLNILLSYFFNYKIIRSFLYKNTTLDKVISAYINYLDELLKDGHWTSIEEIINEVISIGENSLTEKVREWVNSNKTILEEHIKNPF